MNKKRKLINALLVSTMMLSGLALDVSAAEATAVDRIGGKDRVETSVNVSNRAYADKADAVVVAGWEGQPDALTGTLLASAKDAPLLLVSNKDDDIASVRAEIERLGAKTLYILGDTNVVTQKAEDALGTGLTVKRVKGDDRFDTAVAVAKEVGSKTGHAFITVDGRSGELADALAAGPASGKNNSPILLTSKNSLPAQTKQALKDLNISSVTIVGGTSAVSTAVQTAIEAEVSTVNRVNGDDRWETAEEVAKTYFAEADKAIITNDGRVSYADALVGGYFGALNDAPILLTQAGKLNAATTNFLGGRAMSAFVLGKEGVVSTAVKDAVGVIVEKNIAENVLSIESVSPINAKTIEVTFNKAVEDTSKAKVDVVRSTIKQNISKTTWAEDNKSVQLELSAKLMKGDYTVNVKGLADEVLTETVTVEDEKVESIEILSDVAIVNSNTAITEAKVGYQVKNQYGEDITRTTSLTTNDTTNIKVSPAEGIVTIENLNAPQRKVGDKIAIALVHAESAKSVTKTVTLSSESAVADVEVVGIYNKDDKELNEDTVLGTDKFYLIIEAKDQYGNVITTKGKVDTGLIKSETNPTVIKTKGATNKVETEVLTIDGEKKIGLQLQAPTGETTPKAGETQLTLVSTTTGKNASYKVNVSETTRTDVVTLSAPALAVADEDILVPTTVLDKEGNVVTDVKILNDNDKGVAVTFAGKATKPQFVKGEDGNTYIKVLAAQNDTKGIFPLVAQSSTFKVVTSTIDVKAPAEAKTIRGLKNPLAIAAGKDKTLKVADLIVEDQYGRIMKSDKVLDATTGILVRKADASKNIVTLPNEASPVAPADNTIKHNAGVKVTAGSDNGTQVLEFLLSKNDGTETVAASIAESTVRVTDGTEYASYEVAEIGLTQAFDAENDTDKPGVKTFTVNGILNGGKVSLVQGAAEDFTATISGGKGSATVADNKITVKIADLNNSDEGNVATDKTNAVDTEFTLKVTINATGKVLEQKFVVSADKQKVQDFYFTNGNTATNHDSATEVTKAELATGQKVSASGKFVDKDNTQINLATTDQYGNEAVVAIDANWKVTIVPEKASEVTIANNGTKDATATLKGVSEANVTVKLAVGNAVKEIKAVVK